MKRKPRRRAASRKPRAKRAGTSIGAIGSPRAVIPDGAGRFALYTLKALAFIQLKQDNRALAGEILASMRRLDPTGAVGWPVIAALAEGVG